MKYIQRKRTKGWNLEKECKERGIKKENVVSCDRRSKFGNPFYIQKDFFDKNPVYSTSYHVKNFYTRGNYAVKLVSLRARFEPKKDIVLKNMLSLFEEYCEENIELFKQLKGKTLMCWCSEDNYKKGLCNCSIINKLIKNE